MSVSNDNAVLTPKLTVILVLAIVTSTLTGCGSADYSDLDNYVQRIKSQPAGRIDPVPEFKTYETYSYTASSLRDPFEKLSPESDIIDAAGGEDGIRPNIERNKETLEQYPLDTMKFVGHLENGGGKWAIIVTTPDDLVHRVRKGNHLGTNYGEIVSISETKIEIKEIIRDGMGGWIERDAALSISE